MRGLRLSASVLTGSFLLFFSMLTNDAHSGPGQGVRQKAGPSSLKLIPTPQQVELGPGAVALTRQLSIRLADPKDKEDRFATGELSREILAVAGFEPALSERGRGKSILIGRIQNAAVQKRLKALGIIPPDTLGNEGYILDVEEDGILVAANSGAGVYYGVQTLKQLVRSNMTDGALPQVRIVDWPGLRYRGWMLDISRGPIPTMAFLKRIISTLAGYKQNCATLYTEHVFRLKSHPDIAPADGITAEEIAELTAFAREHHVELIGNAQSFAHMENILVSPFYNGIRENSWVITPAREETYAFLRDMYSEIVPAYESPLFHINGDEVSGLGAGPAKGMVDSIGITGVYSYHINRIAELIRPYKKRILMWGDIAVGNPQIIAQLPRDLIVVSWGYGPEESFDNAILPFTKTGFEFIVAPGVSCWNQVWPQMTTAMTNISNYVRDGAKLGAMGMMNTAWMDDGENLSHHNWHGFSWGAECSWRPASPLSGAAANSERATRAHSFNTAFDALFFRTPGVTETLFLFDTLRSVPIRNLVWDQGVWSSMLEQYPQEISDQARQDNERALGIAKDLHARLENLQGKVKQNGEVIDAALFASRRVIFTLNKNLERITLARAMQSGQAEDAAKARGALATLLMDLHRLKAEYAELWRRENRGWSLHRVMEKYDRLGRELADLDKVVSINPENSIVDGKRRIALSTPFRDQVIYYTTDGSEPNRRSLRYSAPFTIDRSSLIRARVFANNTGYGLAEKSVMVHRGVGKLKALNSRYSTYHPAYSGGGEMALVDGVRGSENFSDGRWQAFQGQNLDVVLDLGADTAIKKISIGLLQQSYSWILMPERVQIWTSSDGTDFELVKEVPNSVDPRQDGLVIRDAEAEFEDLETRYVRVVAVSAGKLPAWHHAAGNDSFIFADEIVVE